MKLAKFPGHSRAAPTSQLSFADLPAELMHSIIRRATPDQDPRAVATLSLVSQSFRAAVASYPWSRREYPGWVVHLPEPSAHGGAARGAAWRAIIRDWYSREETLAVMGGPWGMSRRELLVGILAGRTSARPESLLHLASLDSTLLRTGDFRRIADALKTSQGLAAARGVRAIVGAREQLLRAVVTGDSASIRQSISDHEPNAGMAEELSEALCQARRAGYPAAAARLSTGVESLLGELMASQSASAAWHYGSQISSFYPPAWVLGAIWGNLVTVGPAEIAVTLKYQVTPGDHHLPALCDAVLRSVGSSFLGKMLTDVFIERVRSRSGGSLDSCENTLFAALWRHRDVALHSALETPEGHSLGAVLLSKRDVAMEQLVLHRTYHPNIKLEFFRFWLGLHRHPAARERLIHHTLTSLRVPSATHLWPCTQLAKVCAGVGYKLPTDFLLSALSSIVARPREDAGPGREMNSSEVLRASSVVWSFRFEDALHLVPDRQTARQLVAAHFPEAERYAKAHEKMLEVLTGGQVNNPLPA